MANRRILKTVDLQFPVEIEGEERKAITVHRPNGRVYRELMLMGQASDDGGEAQFGAMEMLRVTELLTGWSQDDMDELAFEDLRALSEFVGEFMGDFLAQIAEGKPAGAVSPT